MKSPLQGKTVGRFRLGSTLGEGILTVTFEARDADSGEIVAVKILRPWWAERHNDIPVQFLDGARRASALRHPGIVRTIEAGLQGPLHYIAQERIKGRTLTALIQESPRREEARTLRLALEVAEALAFAHGKGVVHGDLNPRNLFVLEDENVVTADFGLFVPPHLHASFSPSEMYPGRNLFSPPEADERQAPAPSGDVFGFGLLLHVLFTGKFPFSGHSLEDIHTAKRTQAPALSPALDASMTDFLHKVLRRHPADRPPDARHLVAPLTALLADRAAPLGPGTPDGMEDIPTRAIPPGEKRGNDGAPESDGPVPFDEDETLHAFPEKPEPARDASEPAKTLDDVGEDFVVLVDTFSEFEIPKDEDLLGETAPPAAAEAKPEEDTTEATVESFEATVDHFSGQETAQAFVLPPEKRRALPLLLVVILLIALAVVGVTFLPKWLGDTEPSPPPSDAGVADDATGAGLHAKPDTPPPPPLHLEIRKPVRNKVLSTSEVVLEGTVEAGATLEVNGTAVKTAEGAFAVPVPLEEGEREIRVSAVLGDRKRDLVIPVVVDRTPPRFVFAAPSPLFTNRAEAVVEGRVEDPTLDLSCVRLDDRAILVSESGDFSQTVRLRREGSRRIRFRATDRAGNEGEAVLEVIRDTTAPKIVLDVRSPVLTNGRRFGLEGRIEDEYPAPASLTVNGSEAGASGKSFALTLPLDEEGANGFHLKVRDRAGNVGTAGLTVLRDTTEPAVTFFPKNVHIENGRATVPLVFSEAVTRASLGSLETEPPTASAEVTFVLERPAPGKRTFAVRARDAAGNEGRQEITMRLVDAATLVDEALQDLRWKCRFVSSIAKAQALCGEALEHPPFADIGQSLWEAGVEREKALWDEIAARRTFKVIGKNEAVFEIQNGTGKAILETRITRMVRVPGGPFRLGPPGEEGRKAENVASFWMDKTEVTWGQYRLFYATADLEMFCHPLEPASRVKNPRDRLPSMGVNGGFDVSTHESWNGNDQPVVGLTWWDAFAFAKWAGKSLPTEAQWEKAAGWSKGKEKRTYPWGNDIPGLFPSDRSGMGAKHPGKAGTWKLDESPCGALDMAGNVAEWCLDYDAGNGGRLTENELLARHDLLQDTDFRHPVRGGHFSMDKPYRKVWEGNAAFPGDRRLYRGFRCVHAPGAKEE